MQNKIISQTICATFPWLIIIVCAQLIDQITCLSTRAQRLIRNHYIKELLKPWTYFKINNLHKDIEHLKVELIFKASEIFYHPSD